MRRRPLIFALLALLTVFGLATSQADVRQQGDLRVKFNAHFTPHSLPRAHAAPIQVEIRGAVSTTDGSHPPPLRWLEVELNRNGQLTAAGLPVCSASLLQSTTTEQALARCRSAVVGRGEFQAVVALGEDVPTSGKVIAFNSHLDGKPALLLHFFSGVPARFTLVVPLRITRKSHGAFGTLLRTHVPKLAGGLGSITQVDLTIGRRYSSGGRKRSYLSAACSAPKGINIAPFNFARARFRFENGVEFHPKLTDFCQVRSS